jgi:hypothetical protein
MVVISYLYFVCFFFGGFVAKLHVAEWARKDLATTKPSSSKKHAPFPRSTPYALFLLDCLAFLGAKLASFRAP